MTWRKWKAGQTVWCCKNGWSLEPDGWQRGDKGIVETVRPKARKRAVIIRRERDGQRWWFSPVGLKVEDFQTDPPDKPCSDTERAVFGGLGKVVN